MREVTLETLKEMGGCGPVYKKIVRQSRAGITPDEMWLDLENFSVRDRLWLLWKLPVNRKARVLCLIDIVKRTPLKDGRTVYDLMDDPRSKNALTMADAFVSGETTREELDLAIEQAFQARREKRAADAAAADAYAAAYAAYAAADAAAYAAYAAAAAAYAYAAADADAYAAAHAYAAADAQNKILLEHFPSWESVLDARED